MAKSKKKRYEAFLFIIIVSVTFFAIMMLQQSLKDIYPFSATQLGVMMLVLLSTVFVCLGILNRYPIDYLFWRRVLKKRWRYWLVFSFGLLSCLGIFAGLLVFSQWWFYILGGIYLGIVHAICRNGMIRGGYRKPSVLSYKMLYRCYIENADKWEKKLQKRK